MRRSPEAPVETGCQPQVPGTLAALTGCSDPSWSAGQGWSLASASALWALALTACPGAGLLRPRTPACWLTQAPGTGLALNARPPAAGTAPSPGHPALPGQGPPTPRRGALGGLEAAPPRARCGLRAWLLPVPLGQLGRQWPHSLPSGRPSGPPGPGFLRRESRAWE